MKIPVGHVEAGLRTYDIRSPYPEEFNRQAVGILAEYHFAPTSAAADNLLREGKEREHIFVTGNTGIDAMKTTIRKDYSNRELTWAKGSRLIILTAHLRENLGEPLVRMLGAIRRVVDENTDIKVIYPVHPSPQVMETAEKVLGGHERIHLIGPLDVLDFHNFLNQSYLILTDSGGIQEEAVYQAFGLLLHDRLEYDRMSRAFNPYGDGYACPRIADIRAIHQLWRFEILQIH